MELTIERAYELAVKKWQYIVDNDGSEDGLCDTLPELYKFNSKCSYCELFASQIFRCDGCPIRPKKMTKEYGFGCLRFSHPFRILADCGTKENAQAVLDLIIKNKP